METLSLKKIESLPEHLKNEVNDFIDFLLEKEKRKAKDDKPKDIMKFAGILSDVEAEEWEKSISECRKIDLNEW
jgi:Protein of unknown function (DUF2281)